MNQIIEIVKQLGLQPHPEGLYKETYRYGITMNRDYFSGERNLATGIYYLLEEGDFFALYKS